MTVNVYRSTDAGAPVLRGYTPGDMLNLLNKCLVSGYGSLAGAGWTMPIAGAANQAAFKQGAGNGMYLAVDDTDARATYLRNTSFFGYQTLTAWGIGTRQFPLPTQVMNGQTLTGGMRGYTYKVGTAANGRPWKMLANNKFFCLVWSVDDTASPTVYQVQTQSCWEGLIFGDITAFNASDALATVMMGNPYISGPVSVSGYQFPFGDLPVGNFTAVCGVLCGSFPGVGNVPPIIYPGTDKIRANNGYSGRGRMTYPNPVDGSLVLTPIYVMEDSYAAGTTRGVLPGLWFCPQNVVSAMNPGDTVQGTGALAGKTFEVAACGYYSSVWFWEISNTW